MSAGPSVWWLCLPGGKRFRITPAGVLVGRAAHCDLVLVDDRSSRLQAIVFSGARVPRLAVLGQGPTAVNGEPVVRERELAHGDRIALLDLDAEVVAEADVAASSSPTSWVLRSSSSGAFGIARAPFTVGGGPADLRFDGWPPQVLRFHGGDPLQLEAIEPITIDGVEVEAGEIGPLRAGSVVEYAGERLTLSSGGGSRDASATTRSVDRTGVGAARVQLEFMPHGGRLTIGHPRYETTLYLADRRCDLIAALLQPPAPYRPGALVPDDVVCPRVWPGQPKTRTDLNVLLHRVRRDLARADLDGLALVQRAPGGNATRFAVAPDAEVVVR